ncbi:hypothetical protein [Kineococcus sp. SYSU DK004]
MGYEFGFSTSIEMGSSAPGYKPPTFSTTVARGSTFAAVSTSLEVVNFHE